MTSASRTEEAAARWILLREQPDWSGEQQAQLDAWLDAAPQHRVTFYRLECGWNKVDRLAALRTPRHFTPVSYRAFVSGRRLAVMSGAAALCLALVAYGLFQTGFLGRATYETPIGGHLTISLADGTTSVWGTVTSWDPPHAVAYAWHAGTPVAEATSVEVTFTPDEHGHTVVELVHSGWDNRPDGAAARAGYETGWNPVLKHYARFAVLSGLPAGAT